MQQISQIEFCFRYDDQPHMTCPFGLMGTVLMTMEDNPSPVLAHIEENITDLILGQTGPGRVIPGITAITEDVRMEEQRVYFIHNIYPLDEGIIEPIEGFTRRGTVRSSN